MCACADRFYFVLINSLNIDILKHGIASILLIRAELGSEPMIFLDDLKVMQGAREIPVTSLSPWLLNRLVNLKNTGTRKERQISVSICAHFNVAKQYNLVKPVPKDSAPSSPMGKA